MRQLHILSINHQTSTDESREQFHKAHSYMELLLQDMGGVMGYVYVHTCHRVEFYIDADMVSLEDLWHRWKKNAELTSEHVKAHRLSGVESCQRYILRVAMGLDSIVKGDDQILGQLKRAFLSSREKGNLSTLLERSFQSMMRCHKQVCTQTQYRQQSVSLAYHSLKEAKTYFGDVTKDKKVLIIGAGDMAQQIVTYLPKFRFGELHLTNRTRKKAERIAEGREIEILDLSNLDGEWDLVVSCIDNATPYLEECKINLLIDLSVLPHKVLSTRYTIHLKEMQLKLASQEKVRLNDIVHVKEIMEEHIISYRMWTDAWHLRRSVKRAKRA